MAGATWRWFASATAFTVGGLATSLALGAGLALLGAATVGGSFATDVVIAALALAIVSLARELELVTFPVPQLKRQTKRRWAITFPGWIAALLWGAELGLLLTTWLVYSGAWLVPIVAFGSADPIYGAALFAAYWVGRAAPVWLARWLVTSANGIPELLAAVDGQSQLIRQAHVVGVAAVGVSLLMILVGTPA